LLFIEVVDEGRLDYGMVRRVLRVGIFAFSFLFPRGNAREAAFSWEINSAVYIHDFCSRPRPVPIRSSHI